MLLREFPDLGWLKQQVSSHFEARRGWDGKILSTPGWPTVLLNVKAGQVYRDNIAGPFSLYCHPTAAAHPVSLLKQINHGR